MLDEALRRFRAEVLMVAGFLLLPLLLFGNVALGSQTMVPADNLFQWQPWASAAESFGIAYPYNGLLSDVILENYAWKQFIVDSLGQGEIPLWNPYILAGTPFLATGQHSAYYPFSLLFMILPLAKAYGWFTISQLWLAGILAYVLGRTLGLSRPAALVVGLIFQGSGFLVVSSAVFPMILAAAIWLPLLLACVEKIIRHAGDPDGGGHTLPWALIAAAALALQVLAGHIEITYYTLLVMGFFSAWRLLSLVHLLARSPETGDGVRGRGYAILLKPAAWLLAVVLVGLMLGAVQFVPFVEVGQSNFREGSATLEEIRGWAFPPRRLLTFAMPDFFGNPSDHDYVDARSLQRVPFTTNSYGQINPHGPYSSSWGIKNYVEGGVYLGVLGLLLAGLGLWSGWRHWRGQRANILFFAVLSLLCLSFIFGTPLYALLYYGLPGVNQLHSPFRWVFPLSIAVAALAGYGLEAVTATNKPGLDRAGRWKWLLFGAGPSVPAVAAALATWSGLLLAGGLFVSRSLYPRLEPAVNRVFLNLTRAPDAFDGPRAFYSYTFEQALILSLALIGAGLAIRLAHSRLVLRGRAVWQPLVIAILGLDLFVAGYGFHSAVDPALLAHEPALVSWLKEQPGHWRLTTFTPHGDKPLNANTPWLYGLMDVRGYDSVILKQYAEYMSAIEPQNELQFNRVQPIVHWESLNSPLLDLLGVRYIITAETLELPKLDLVWQGEGLKVYENLAVVSRAYTMPMAATVVEDDPLVAMRERDPRQYVIVGRDDWAALSTPPTLPGSPEARALEPAEIVAYGNVEARVAAEVVEPSWLVLNDTYFQGWDVFARPLDGSSGSEEKLELLRVNGNFRGVALEQGRWEVRFRYSPLSFKLGGLTSFMGGMVLLFALVVWGWRRLYRPSGPLSDAGSVAKNSLAPMALNLFNRAIDFVYAAFYLRLLGPTDAGKFATAIIIAGWFEIISNFGLNTLVIREVSKDRSQASRYLLNTSVLRLGTGLIAGLPILVYIVGVDLAGNALGPDTTLAILLIMVGMVFSGMGQGLAGLYYAHETAEFPAAVTTVTTILKVGFGVLALLLGYGFVGLAAVSILVNFLTLLILTISAFRHFDLSGPWQVDFGLQRRMVTASYPLMLNHLFAVIFFQIDVPLMRQINGEEEVGWYNSAYKYVNAFNVIPAFFTFGLFPVITRQVHSALSDARRTFRLSLKLMLLIAFPLAAVTSLLAPLMIRILGGSEFLPHGAVALQLVVWSIPLGWMNSVTNYVLIALGLERRLTVAFIIGVAFNTVTNLIFLPRYSYLAASATTIASELLLLLLFAAYLRPAMPGVRWLAIIKRPLAVTALMLWAMVLGALVNTAVAVALGLLVYPLGLWALRVFGPEERRILRSLVPERLSARFAFSQTTP
jgi:O-antigen/teichoic acid export membrane protein